MCEDLDFSIMIETMATERRINKLDAILAYCSEQYIDPIEVVPFISQSLKDKIELEAQEEGKLPQTSTAPLK